MTEHDEIWLPLVDEPIGGIVAQIQADDPEIERLVGLAAAHPRLQDVRLHQSGREARRAARRDATCRRTTARRPGSSCSFAIPPTGLRSRRRCGRSPRRSPQTRATATTSRSARTRKPGHRFREFARKLADLGLLEATSTHPGIFRIMGAVPLQLLAFFLLACCLAAVGASTGTTAKAPVVSAGAYAVQVNIPGQPGGERRRRDRAERGDDRNGGHVRVPGGRIGRQDRRPLVQRVRRRDDGAGRQRRARRSRSSTARSPPTASPPGRRRRRPRPTPSDRR